jgi:hypothetical protein
MLAEEYKIVPIFQDGDMSSTITGDSVNMKNFHSATFIFTFGTLGTASSVLTINSGTSAGAASSALTVNYAWGGAAIGTAVAGSTASCDVLADWTAAASVTITHGSYDNYMLVVEVNAAAMDLVNGEEWLTPVLTDPGTATGTVDCIAILKPRYTGNRSATALA